MKCVNFTGFILLSFLFIPTVAYPQVGKLVREVSEAILKKSGKEGVESFVEFGGEAATKELLEKAMRDGGEELAEKTVAYMQRYGVDALKILSEDPKSMVAALESLPSSLASRAVSEGARNPAVITRVVRQHGDEALKVCAEHPGVGLQIVDTYGEAGIKAARKLSTDDLILLARQSKGFEKLPVSAKKEFTDILANDPKTVLTYFAGGTGIVLTAAVVQDLKAVTIGSPEEPGPIVKPIVFWSWILGAVLMVLLVAYFTPKIWGSFRLQKLKVEYEKTKTTNKDAKD